MPYLTFTISVKVPTQAGSRTREIMETALDQFVIEEIDASEISVVEMCADPPSEDLTDYI